VDVTITRPTYRTWSQNFVLNSGSEMPILIAVQRVDQKEPAVSFMVLYTGLDGSAAFGRCEGLTDAVAEVERLRNEQSIEDARIYRLEEVKFEIKPYFRVEIPGSIAGEPSPTALVTVATAPSSDAPPAAEEPSWTTPPAPSTADVPSMTIPPPPPPPPAPVAPMAFDAGPRAEEEDAAVGSRRGLFGR
jgi:hypothetical protein